MRPRPHVTRPTVSAGRKTGSPRASKLSNLAETLRTSDLQSLLGKNEEFARRQPVLFAGAAMALGFVPGLT